MRDHSRRAPLTSFRVAPRGTRELVLGPVLVLVAALGLDAASAQNVLSNPSFDSDTQSWDVFNASLGHTLADGDAAAGAAELDGTSFAMLLSQCVTADFIGPVNVGFAASVKLASAGGAVTDLQYEVGTAFFGSTDCMPPFLGTGGGTTGVDLVTDPATGVWIRLDGTSLLPIGIDAHSATLNVTIRQDSPITFLAARVDDAYLGSERPLFADGFESGDTNAWSQ